MLSPRGQLNTVDNDADSLISEGDRAAQLPAEIQDNNEFKQMDSIQQRYDSIMKVDQGIPQINNELDNHFASLEEKINEVMQDKPLFQLEPDEPEEKQEIQKENYKPVLESQPQALLYNEESVPALPSFINNEAPRPDKVDTSAFVSSKEQLEPFNPLKIYDEQPKELKLEDLLKEESLKKITDEDLRALEVLELQRQRERGNIAGIEPAVNSYATDQMILNPDAKTKALMMGSLGFS